MADNSSISLFKGKKPTEMMAFIHEEQKRGADHIEHMKNDIKELRKENEKIA